MSVFAIYMSTNLFVTSPNPYATAYDSISVEVKQVEVVEPTVRKFVRSRTTIQNQPCRNSQGGVYESDILSREEIEYNLRAVGFTPEQSRVMQAIAKAESGHQLNCFGDESLVTSKWNFSYGVFQIRGLKAETGRGTCRDVERLRLSIVEQSKCAYEISGGGKNFRPWSMYLNGGYRKWL